LEEEKAIFCSTKDDIFFQCFGSVLVICGSGYDPDPAF
jgi:hypothetical protein